LQFPPLVVFWQSAGQLYEFSPVPQVPLPQKVQIEFADLLQLAEEGQSSIALNPPQHLVTFETLVFQ